MAINRTPFNALVDDDGTNTVGSVWNKSAIATVILDPADVAYAPFASPALTGIPTAPTAAGGTSSTQLATTAFVQTAAAPPVWVAVAYNAANFVGTGSMTWTVDSADQLRYSYLVNGKTMTLSFWLDSTTLSGTAAGEVRISIPGANIPPGANIVKSSCIGTFSFLVGNVPANSVIGTIRAITNNAFVSLVRIDGTNFPIGTNIYTFAGTFVFEIT